MAEELTREQAAKIVADTIRKGVPPTEEQLVKQRKKDAEYAEKLRVAQEAFKKRKEFDKWQEENRGKT